MSTSADPDLVLCVTQEALADGRRALRFVAKTREPQIGLYFASFNSKPFYGDPQTHFLRLFHDLGQLQLRCSEDWISGRATQLCQELLPLELQRRLWGLLDCVRTVQILSDEIWIPWELLRIQNPDDPSSPGRFLVEAFSVTRWLLESPLVTDLPIRRMGLVIPRDSGLPKSSAEGVQLKALSGSAREIVDVSASVQELKDAMKSGEFDGWHFAGHGQSSDESLQGWSLVLERGKHLHPAALYSFAHQESRRPLIFLNACHSGRGAPSLTGLDGWASAFLNLGAGAFVGTHWALADEQAFWFSKEFYTHLFLGLAIGEAVWNARMSLRARFPGSSDWLSYTVFAHPLARCSAAPMAQQACPARPRKTGGGEKKRDRVIRRSSVPRAPEPRTSPSAILPSPTESTAPREPAPGEERIHEKDGTILVYVPGGEITLGDETIHPWSRPLRRTRISPFWIARFPVTNDQFSAFLRENPDCRRPAFWEDSRFNQPQHPVVGISWEEAQAYCRWAGLELPSEAQWELAARGKDRRPYPWGRELPTPRHANFGGAGGGTTPVGAYNAGIGPYGTLDQAGNVWEWCADPWASDAYRQMEDGQQDPIANGDTAVRALRGGSWMNTAQDLHAAYRDRGTAKLRLNNQGFRCSWRPA